MALISKNTFSFQLVSCQTKLKLLHVLQGFCKCCHAKYKVCIEQKEKSRAWWHQDSVKVMPPAGRSVWALQTSDY